MTRDERDILQESVESWARRIAVGETKDAEDVLVEMRKFVTVLCPAAESLRDTLAPAHGHDTIGGTLLHHDQEIAALRAETAELRAAVGARSAGPGFAELRAAYAGAALIARGVRNSDEPYEIIVADALLLGDQLAQAVMAVGEITHARGGAEQT